jgi:hypothetical protein
MFTPALCADVLEGRLPRPVEDLEQWNTDAEDDDDEQGGSHPSVLEGYPALNMSGFCIY